MATEKFEIRNRWTGEVQVTAEINCAPDALPSVKLGLAVRWALKERANLGGANLSRANLGGANLSRANLSDANLSRANLSGANLSDANLSDANLSRANLSDANLSRANLGGANLSDANLSRANLSDANLSDANLSDANLSGANLSRANLSGVNLSDAQLRTFKADMWMTLTQNPREVPGLIAALRAGKINGSQYEGDCACLVGTLANLSATPYSTLDHNANNPAEIWFAMISEGDKPGDDTGGGYAAQKALEWALEWCQLCGVNPDGAPAVLDAA